MKVEIYYGELKSQQITQAPAYDVIAFFGEYTAVTVRFEKLLDYEEYNAE